MFFLLYFIIGIFLPRPVMAAGAPQPVAVTEEVFLYNDGNKRDPFVPLVTAGGAIVMTENSYTVSEMILEGIITSGGSDGQGGLAIINGTVVEQGKPFGLYTVEKIEVDKVTLQKDGQISVLRLKKEE